MTATISKLDESCISNPKSEIADWTAHSGRTSQVQFKTSDFGFEMQDSSNFKFPLVSYSHIRLSTHAGARRSPTPKYFCNLRKLAPTCRRSSHCRVNSDSYRYFISS